MTRYSMTWYDRDDRPHAAVNLTPGALAELSRDIVFRGGGRLLSERQPFIFEPDEIAPILAYIRSTML